MTTGYYGIHLEPHQEVEGFWVLSSDNGCYEVYANKPDFETIIDFVDAVSK